MIKANLVNGDGIIACLTPEHSRGVMAALHADGIDIEAAEGRGQLDILDSHQTMTWFMVDDMPDHRRFRELIGARIDTMQTRHLQVQVYGEMVNIMRAAGNHAATVALEQAWNDLAEHKSFRLHCIYHLRTFDQAADIKDFTAICALHTHVHPPEELVQLATPEHQARAFAELQQKAVALEAEVQARRRLEASLRRSEGELLHSQRALEAAYQSDHFRHLAEAMPQLVWSAASSGILSYCNQRWRAYTGDTSLAPHWLAAVDERDYDRAEAAWRAAIATRQPLTVERRLIRRADGQSRWHLTRATPVLSRAGQITRWFGTDTDIEEQKRLQGDLAMARNKAEQASRTKSAFLANMSHEIRTPLGAIIGFSDLLRDDAIPPAAKRTFIETIIRNGQQLATLIDDILDLSKVEAGRLDIERLPFSVRNLITDELTSLDGKAKQKALALTVTWEPGTPDIVVTDPLRLRQIVTNIIGNALKFTAAGGVHVTVGVAAPRADHGTAQGESLLRISVQDTGCGIAKSQRDRLFQPFSQADSSTTRRFGGTGLGLVLSRQLARLLHGDVTLGASHPGQGSTFHLTVGIGTPDDERSRQLETRDRPGMGDASVPSANLAARGEAGVAGLRPQSQPGV